MGKIFLNSKMKAILFTLLLWNIPSAQMLLKTPNMPVLQLVLPKENNVKDMNQCIGDVTKAVQDISQAAANANFANVMASIEDLVNAIKDCAGLFVDFSDDCKNDYSDLMKMKDTVMKHLETMDVDSLKQDLQQAEHLFEMMLKDCKPVPKNEGVQKDHANLKMELARMLIKN